MDYFKELAKKILPTSIKNYILWTTNESSLSNTDTTTTLTRTTSQGSSLYQFLFCWFMSAALVSTLISIPVSMAFLPIILITLIPALVTYLIVLYSAKVFLVFLGRNGLFYKTIKLILGRGTGLITDLSRNVFSRFTFMGRSQETREYPLEIDLKGDLKRSSMEQIIQIDSLPPKNTSSERQLHKSTSRDSSFLPESDLARYLALSSGSRLSLVSTIADSVIPPSVEFRFLDPVSDADQVYACSHLFTKTTRSSHVVNLKCGLSPDKKMIHHILSLWKNGFMDEDEELIYSLVGFIEYFHKVRDPSCVFIEKLIMNSLFEGMGFSRQLVKQLQATESVSCIEVWSLWRSEGFYKGLGFTDVVSKSGTTDLDGNDTNEMNIASSKRVVGEYGPLLIWTKLK